MFSAVAEVALRTRTSNVPLRLLIMTLVTVFFLAGCRSVDPVVKVGLVAPFEGRHRAIGYDTLYSARLAVRELNAAGGINGTRVALVALDDSGNPQFAAATADALIIDPAVVAVVGHWLPETSAVAQARYDGAGLAFVTGGEAPFAPIDPQQLAPQFVADYEAVTPFDEEPGPYAGPAYEAYQLLWQTLARAQAEHGAITRVSVMETLEVME